VSHYDVAPNVIANVQIYNNTVAHVGTPKQSPTFCRRRSGASPGVMG
jgi:hypothetical protein